MVATGIVERLKLAAKDTSVKRSTCVSFPIRGSSDGPYTIAVTSSTGGRIIRGRGVHYETYGISVPLVLSRAGLP